MLGGGVWPWCHFVRSRRRFSDPAAARHLFAPAATRRFLRPASTQAGSAAALSTPETPRSALPLPIWATGDAHFPTLRRPAASPAPRWPRRGPQRLQQHRRRPDLRFLCQFRPAVTGDITVLPRRRRRFWRSSGGAPLFRPRSNLLGSEAAPSSPTTHRSSLSCIVQGGGGWWQRRFSAPAAKFFSPLWRRAMFPPLQQSVGFRSGSIIAGDAPICAIVHGAGRRCPGAAPVFPPCGGPRCSIPPAASVRSVTAPSALATPL